MENWQCRIQVRGPGGGGGGGGLFLDQTEAQRAEKNFFETTPPPPLSQGLDDRAPHYLKVWIRRWLILSSFLK